MFICLSSGAAPRYKEDVLRALAMPRGAQLQFRYDLARWVAPRVRKRLDTGTAAKTHVLICYIDQQDPPRVPDLVPCRFATLLEEPRTHGTTVSLVLSLEELAYAENLAAFNTELSGLAAGTLPSWQPDGSITGSYWLEVSQEPTTVIRSENLREWENIVTQLAAHTEFSDENRFYTVAGIYEIGREQSIVSAGGVHALSPGKEYEVRVYHFNPIKTPGGRVRIRTSSDAVTVATAPSMLLDSRYDLKRVRIRTGRPVSPERAVLTLSYEGEDEGEPSLEFDLGVEIAGTFVATLGKGITLGVLLAMPQVIAPLANPTLPPANQAVIASVGGLLGLVAGVVAAFGLKKTV